VATQPTEWHTAWIGLGSNLGDKKTTIETAICELDEHPQCAVQAVSSGYRSNAVGPGIQPDYLNAILRLRTTLEATELMRTLFDIEKAHGRQRGLRWAPRTLDLDLLLFDDLQTRSVSLTLPHPRMHQRGFVLVPLLEIDPTLNMPHYGPVRKLEEGLDTNGLEKVCRFEIQLQR